MLQVLLGTGETGGKVEVAEVQEGGAPEDALSIGDDSGTVTRVELPENEKVKYISFVKDV